MITGNRYKMYPYNKKLSVPTSLENRLNNDAGGGVSQRFSNYIKDGYTLVYAPTSGPIDLSTQLSGKYLVAWHSTALPTIAPSARMQLSTGYTIVSSTGGLHEDVVIFGAGIDGNGVISDFGIRADFQYVNSNHSDYQKVLTFDTIEYRYSIYNLTYKRDGQVMENSVWYPYPTGGSVSGVDVYFGVEAKNTKFYVGGNHWIRFIDDNGNNHWDNCEVLRWEGIGEGAGGYTYYTYIQNPTTEERILSNCSFNYEPTTKPYYIQIRESASKSIVGFVNSAVNYQPIIVPYSANVENNIVYYDKNGGIAGGGAYLYNQKYKKIEKQEINYGVVEIDWNVVDFDDFVNLDADYSAEYIIDNTQFYNLGTRQNYSVTFTKNYQVNDDIKNFSNDNYYFFERDDIARDLVSSSAPNYLYQNRIYKSTNLGSTDIYDYKYDENFLIRTIQVSSTSEKKTFEFYNEDIKKTVFSDVRSTELYKIDKTFQIWEIDSMSNVKEIHKDKNTRQGITNGPLSGSIKFNNLDNEILERD